MICKHYNENSEEECILVSRGFRSFGCCGGGTLDCIDFVIAPDEFNRSATCKPM